MGRAPCCDRNGVKKGPWTPEEDHKLISYIQLHGPGNWRSLPKNAGLQRCGKSCRLRWTNYLRPDIKRGRFSFDEEETIIQLHSVLGNKWSAIAARLPGRTDNEIKNYWNTHIRKRLLRNGIDPVTHALRLDFLDLSSIISSALCNSSSLLGLSTVPILNPQLLRLASTLSLLKQQNPDLLMQHLQDNNNNQQQQIINTLIMQNQASFLPQTAPNHNQFDNIPAQQSVPNSDPFFIQPNVEESSNLSQPNLVYCNNINAADQYNIPGESSGFGTVNNGYQNHNMESAISSPGDQLNSSSTYLNSNISTEDDCGERESYCSSLFKFEIPESLDFDDFL